MKAQRALRVGVLALLMAGCGVAVHADRSSVGGGPEQATAQARARIQTTAVAAATTIAQYTSGEPCDCSTAGK